MVEYVVKPIREANLSKLLEECAKNLLKNSKTIIKLLENTFYDFDNKTITCKNQNILLTNKEVEFIEILIAHRGNLVTKQEIEDKLYIYEEAPFSALKNLVFKLRKKLNIDIIQTVSKLGYMIK